jgi:precorrin-2 dehydrogenase/sirohydrochlorin ferrochelatase
MKPYPVMLRISGKRVIVIGGGRVALRKIRDLMECGALVRVIAPQVHESVHDLAARYPDKIEIVNRAYERGDCEGAFLVFSATGDERVSREVFQEAEARNIFINAVDDPRHCTFFVPSWSDTKGIIVAVSTSGVSPALAARIRRDVERALPDSMGEALVALEKTRNLLKSDPDFKTLNAGQRGRVLTRIVGDDDLLAELVKCYVNDSLKCFIKELLSDDPPSATGLAT